MTTHFDLSLSMDVDLNGEEPELIGRAFDHVIERAMGEGLFTGDSNAEIATWHVPRVLSAPSIALTSGSVSTWYFKAVVIGDAHYGLTPQYARVKVDSALLETIQKAAPLAGVGSNMSVRVGRAEIDWRGNPRSCIDGSEIWIDEGQVFWSAFDKDYVEVAITPRIPVETLLASPAGSFFRVTEESEISAFDPILLDGDFLNLDGDDNQEEGPSP